MCHLIWQCFSRHMLCCVPSRPRLDITHSALINCKRLWSAINDRIESKSLFFVVSQLDIDTTYKFFSSTILLMLNYALQLLAAVLTYFWSCHTVKDNTVHVNLLNYDHCITDINLDSSRPLCLFTIFVFYLPDLCFNQTKFTFRIR